MVILQGCIYHVVHWKFGLTSDDTGVQFLTLPISRCASLSVLVYLQSACILYTEPCRANCLHRHIVLVLPLGQSCVPFTFLKLVFRRVLLRKYISAIGCSQSCISLIPVSALPAEPYCHYCHCLVDNSYCRLQNLGGLSSTHLQHIHLGWF
jgi:hypothetical protein